MQAAPLVRTHCGKKLSTKRWRLKSHTERARLFYRKLLWKEGVIILSIYSLNITHMSRGLYGQHQQFTHQGKECLSKNLSTCEKTWDLLGEASGREKCPPWMKQVLLGRCTHVFTAGLRLLCTKGKYNLNLIKSSVFNIHFCHSLFYHIFLCRAESESYSLRPKCSIIINTRFNVKPHQVPELVWKCSYGMAKYNLFPAAVRANKVIYGYSVSWMLWLCARKFLIYLNLHINLFNSGKKT